jgi:nucleoside-diphosphate-sugar epimerase
MGVQLWVDNEGARGGRKRGGRKPVVRELVERGHDVVAIEPEGVVNVASKWSVNPARVSRVAPANEIREHGARNVVGAAVAAGARRYVNESMMFIYGYGDHPEPLTETDPPARVR